MIGEQVPLSILAERLSHAEIFGGLGREDLLAIAQFSHEESCREGDIVLEEGQPAYRLFVVERGKLALDKKVQLGRHSTPLNATVGYVGTSKMAGFSTIVSPQASGVVSFCLRWAVGI